MSPAVPKSGRVLFSLSHTTIHYSKAVKISSALRHKIRGAEQMTLQASVTHSISCFLHSRRWMPRILPLEDCDSDCAYNRTAELKIIAR